MGKMRNGRGLGILSALSLLGAAACARVKPEELDTSLAALREEMTQQIQQGDQAVEQRVGQQLGGRISTVEQRTAALETDLQQMERDFEVAIQRLEDAIRFDDAGENVNATPALLQVQGGKPVVVGPARFAEAKPVFPVPKWRG